MGDSVSPSSEGSAFLTWVLEDAGAPWGDLGAAHLLSPGLRVGRWGQRKAGDEQAQGA